MMHLDELYKYLKLKIRLNFCKHEWKLLHWNLPHSKNGPFNLILGTRIWDCKKCLQIKMNIDYDCVKNTPKTEP